MGAERDLPSRSARENHDVARAPLRDVAPDAAPVPEDQSDVDTVAVVVVDDHAGFRSAVRTMLELDGRCHVSGEASSVATALELLDTLPDPPDLVLLDVNLGEVDGMRGAALVAERHPTVPVLLCSTAPQHELPPMPVLPGVSFVPKELLDGNVVWGAAHHAREH